MRISTHLYILAFFISCLLGSCSSSRYIEYRDILLTDSVHDTTTIVQTVFRTDSFVSIEKEYIKDSSFTDYLRGRYDSLRGAFVDTLRMFQYYEKNLLRENDLLRKQLEKDSVSQRNSEKSSERISLVVDDKQSNGNINRPKEPLSRWQVFSIYSGYAFWLIILTSVIILYVRKKK